MPATNSIGGTAVIDSQGSIFVFNSKAFQATKITIEYGGGSSSSGGASQIDVSTLDLASGSDKVYQSPPLNEVTSAGGTGVIATISLDFIGLEKPVLNSEFGIDLGAKLAISGKAKCTAYSLDAAVNDILRGTAKFDLTSADSVYTKITPTP